MPALHPQEGMASRVAAVAVGMFSLRPPDIVDCRHRDARPIRPLAAAASYTPILRAHLCMPHVARWGATKQTAIFAGELLYAFVTNGKRR